MTKEELEEVVEHDRRIRAAINACLKALIDFPVEDKRAVVDELDQRVALEEQRAIVTTARQQLEAELRNFNPPYPPHLTQREINAEKEIMRQKLKDFDARLSEIDRQSFALSFAHLRLK